MVTEPSGFAENISERIESPSQFITTFRPLDLWLCTPATILSALIQSTFLKGRQKKTPTIQ